MRTELQNKQKVLVFIDWYLPGYKAGGPVRSCSNLLNLLKDHFDFSVITGNTDYLESEPYSGIPSGRWTSGPGNVRIFYLNRQKISATAIKKAAACEPFDKLYLNSLFSFWFTIMPLLLFWKRKKDVILAPRGMLAPDALKIKGLKKSLFLKLAKITGLYEGITWHAATEDEELDIRRFAGKSVRVKIAANVPGDGKVSHNGIHKRPGTVNLYLAGRIAPIKNLHLVLEALSHFNSRLDCRLDVIGPVDDENYMNRCRVLANQLRSKTNVKVRLTGPAPHDSLLELLKDFHFLVLPSGNESFGHAILEALSSGIPVIISDNTPWKGLENKKAGWNVNVDDSVELLSAIEKAARMDEAEYREWSAGARKVVEDFRNESGLMVKNLDLFR